MTRFEYLQVISALFMLLVIAVSIGAEVPLLINYQGRLTDSDGTPIDTTADLIVSIYHAENGVGLAWEETHTDVTVTDGLFNILLGSNSPMNTIVFSGNMRWLGIRIDGSPTLMPLTPLVSVPHAYRSINADTAAYALAAPSSGNASGWIDNGTKVVQVDYATDSVGIGTQFPSAKLHVIGDVIVSGRTSFGVSQSISGSRATITGGYENNALADYAAISGGSHNSATANYSTVGGGVNNAAQGLYSTVAGGESDTASGSHSTVSGGYTNMASGVQSTVGGGKSNDATNSATTVAGGQYNEASGLLATVCGGGSNQSSGDYSTIAGGRSNRAGGEYSFVGGGGGGLASDSNYANGAYSTVTGGKANGATGDWSVTSGGRFNEATNFSTTVAGGQFNDASGQAATVGGGGSNESSGNYSTIAGGYYNKARGAYAFIGGGGGSNQSDSNYAHGAYSIIPGGRANAATGDYSFAAGCRAKANHHGAFVWADSTNADFVSTGENQFLIRANGGVGIGVTSPDGMLELTDNSDGVALHFSNADRDITWTSGQSLQLGDWNGATFNARMRINYDGNIGMGTIAPNGQLHVRGNADDIALHLSNAAGDVTWPVGNTLNMGTWDGATFTEHMRITSGGNVGIGGLTSTPNILTVIQYSATDPIADSWGTYSSRRWKENIKPLDNALDKVQRLRGVSYDWKETGEHDIGLIAEEVGEIVPEVVAYDENGIDAQSVDYARLVSVLIEAVKEQQAQIETLSDRIEELEEGIR